MKNKGLLKYHTPLSWVYAGGIFLILVLPLLNLPPWFAPPDWGKTFVLRIVVSFLFLFFLWQFLFNPQLEKTIAHKLHFQTWSAKTIIYALLFLACSFALATAFSTDPVFSLWGDPTRSGGFVNFLSFILFSFAAFLFLSKHAWNVAWNIAVVTGIGVSLIALFQQFGIFHTFFIWSETRPPSTVGGSIFLAMYLLLLIFPIISFCVRIKYTALKIFYAGTAAFFLAVIFFISQTRSALLGIGIGFFWFLFAYPGKKKLFKITAISSSVAVIVFLYILKIYTPFYETLPPLLRNATGRILTLTEGLQTDESRISAWKISWNAFLARPVTGYGPENFAVGFDKFYDPSLPKMAKVPALSQISWWDRAHNMIFDVAMQEGIFALFAYGVLFVAVFWQLSLIKRAGTSGTFFAHALQSSFAAFLVANMFAFDVFSTYLMFFFLIAFVLRLSFEHEKENVSEQNSINDHPSIKIFDAIKRYKYAVFPVTLLIAFWVLWKFDILPFLVNTEINRANYYVQKNACSSALRTFDQAFQKEQSFLNTYVRLQYIDALSVCGERIEGEEKYALVKKGYERFKEAVAFRPTYTRNWILLGKLTNGLADIEKSRGNTEMSSRLLAEADSYLQKAHILSPKRQEVYIEWIQTDILAERYGEAKRKSEGCLALNAEFGECWWMKGITELYLQQKEQAEHDIAEAVKWNYKTESLISLTQLARAYSVTGNKSKLTDTYEKLSQIKPNDTQILGTLAWLYRDLKQYGKARETALKLAQVNPETQEEVARFLQTLP